MPSTISLGNVSKIDHARYTVTLASGKRLVLFRLPEVPGSKTTNNSQSIRNGWQYFCMESECPHAGGPMGDSEVTYDVEDSSYIASCPWHSYDFNLDTGQSSYGLKACTYPISIINDTINLQLPSNLATETLASIEPISEKVKLKHTTPLASYGHDAPHTRQTPSDDASLSEWCTHILQTSNPEHKIEFTTHLYKLFVDRETSDRPMPLAPGTAPPPDTPPRENMQQVQPWNMPNPGKGGTLKSRVNMLHALANIEQWAIDLALDICVRFAGFTTQSTQQGATPTAPLPRTYFHDWLKVASDEAKHFSLLRSRLEDLGSHFGALPVHHGLWDSATMTAHDLRARISVIALVHEARGLDVNPMTIEKFRKAGDGDSVDCLEIIHRDEITHVTTGHRWLSWICEQEGSDPVQVFRSNVQKYFKGAVKGPFNAEDRQKAGMDAVYYENLSGTNWPKRGHVIAGG